MQTEPEIGGEDLKNIEENGRIALGLALHVPFFADALEDMNESNFSIYKKIKDYSNFGTLLRAVMYRRIAQLQNAPHGSAETSK